MQLFQRKVGVSDDVLTRDVVLRNETTTVAICFVKNTVLAYFVQYLGLKFHMRCTQVVDQYLVRNDFITLKHID